MHHLSPVLMLPSRALWYLSA